MLKCRLFAIIALFSLMFMMPVVSDAAETNKVKMTKRYELTQFEKQVVFTVTGYKEAFAVELVLPDGYTIAGKVSDEMKDRNGSYWTSTFEVNGARQGEYTFYITGSGPAYYNLSVAIPHFADLTNHWSQSRVNEFVKEGIVSGYADGSFRPEEAITGEELIKIAMMVLTEEIPNGQRQWKRSFRWQVKDMALSRSMGMQQLNFNAERSAVWSEPYVQAASSIRIRDDWGDEQLAKSFARKDVALLLANVIQMTNTDDGDGGDMRAQYTDISDLPDKYKKAIDLVSAYAIFEGYPDGSFKPEEPVSRAEAVTVLSRLNDFY